MFTQGFALGVIVF